jgi:hypothetical protein
MSALKDGKYLANLSAIGKSRIINLSWALKEYRISNNEYRMMKYFRCPNNFSIRPSFFFLKNQAHAAGKILSRVRLGEKINRRIQNLIF